MFHIPTEKVFGAGSHGGSLLKINVIPAHACACWPVSLLSTFFHMLKWLTYVSLWLSTQISFWQNMPKKHKYICHKAFIEINFLLTTPSKPLSPGRFVVRNCVFSSGTSDKFCSPLWYFLQCQIFFATFQASSCKELFITSWKDFGRLGSRRGFSVYFSRIWLHHHCV